MHDNIDINRLLCIITGKEVVIMLKLLRENKTNFDLCFFINELCEASKKLGYLESKIASYQFDTILIPTLHKKEAISSMYIEGTQTTINDAFESEVNPNAISSSVSIEITNHIKALLYGSDYLRSGVFSHSFIKKIHELMMSGIAKNNSTLGEYKKRDNRIVNSAGTVVYNPPPHSQTKKYMDDLIDYINDKHDETNPLLKAAIMHAQFESIHPFEDGNGRVGRLLVSLYLYKAKVINFPFFYLSEAISQDKGVYYRKLTDTRSNNYNEWIKYFLDKIIIQTIIQTKYIDELNNLYVKVKTIMRECINSPKYEQILNCLFTHPVLTSAFLSEQINVSTGQCNRYLLALEKKHILQGNDRQRKRTYYFTSLLDLARRA